MQFSILWCNDCTYISCFYALYDAFPGKPGVKWQPLTGGTVFILFWWNVWYHMDTGFSNDASNVQNNTCWSLRIIGWKNRWIGGCVYECNSSIVENAAQSSIITKHWQLNNCQVLNFQGAWLKFMCEVWVNDINSK